MPIENESQRFDCPIIDRDVFVTLYYSIMIGTQARTFTGIECNMRDSCSVCNQMPTGERTYDWDKCAYLAKDD